MFKFRTPGIRVPYVVVSLTVESSALLPVTPIWPGNIAKIILKPYLENE
jgi:hypothetical protein